MDAQTATAISHLIIGLLQILTLLYVRSATKS